MANVTDTATLAIPLIRLRISGTSTSSTLGTPNTPTVASVNNSVSAAQKALARTCSSVVKEHRNSNLSLAQATIQIFSILQRDSFGTEAFNSYVDQLTQTERELATATVRGATSLPTDVPTMVDPPVQPVVLPSTVQDSSEQTLITAKRSAHQAFNTSIETSKTDDDESSYAWTDVPIPTSYLNAGIARTLYLKSVYQRDIKRAKNTLIIRPDCPNFPDALWVKVLLNKYIDLDKIFVGHYALECDSPQLQPNGDPDSFVSHANASKGAKTI